MFVRPDHAPCCAVGPSVDARRLVLTVEALPARLQVECDDVRVAQLIANVLGNASKYPQEEGTIDVAVALAGNAVCVHVSDNGIGIAADRLTDIFTYMNRWITLTQGVARHGNRPLACARLGA